MTKKDFQKYLNEIPIPITDSKSFGGRIPDNAKYGDWMRRNDPIMFEVGFQELKRENESE
jgi:hypothetical protein